MRLHREPASIFLSLFVIAALGCDDGTVMIKQGTGGDSEATDAGTVGSGSGSGSGGGGGTVGTGGPTAGTDAGTGGGTAGTGGGTAGTGGGTAGTGGGTAGTGGGTAGTGGGTAGTGGGTAGTGGGTAGTGGGTVGTGGGTAGTGGGATGTGGGATATGGTIDQAVVVVHSLPTQLACSQRMNVTVTVRNMGDTTWTDAGNYRLGAVDDQDPLFTGNRINLGPTDSIAPGQEHTFSFELVAQGAGAITTDWRMVRDGVHWFGDIARRDITVACAATGAFYPCVIDGRFDMPDHDQRIASRNASLLRGGHAITGNDAIDNAVLGGGSPDGGIWLSGQFHFEIDINGQITSASWITVFSAVQYPVTGGVYPNGEVHMGSPAGLDISGLISNGMVTGYVAEGGMTISRGGSVWNSLSTTDRSNLRGIWNGDDVEYVHGVMSGTWAPR